MEWKLALNKRTAANQTEDNLVVAPSDLWNEELASKITDIVQSTGKSYKCQLPPQVLPHTMPTSHQPLNLPLN